MSAITAVVAAGGYGVRCNSEKPKALLRKEGKTYLEMLLVELARAGIDDLILYCNRQEYGYFASSISNKIMSTRLVIDRGFLSTFELAKHSASLTKAQKILFCYGHSPRPAEHVVCMLSQRTLPAVSVLDSTTKKSVLKYHAGGYLEPPYILCSASLRNTSSQDWSSYFLESTESIVGISIEGPHEFNYTNERHLYNRYIDAWLYRNHDLTMPSTRTQNTSLRSVFCACDG
ncbi:MAG: NTP transferase domain-containing protein [Candidatus Thiodiazotropha sp.]